MLDIRKLLEFDMENGVEKGEKSILNFKNAEFLAQNLEDPTAITQYFDLGADINKGKALATYYSGIQQAFSQYTTYPKLDYYKARFARDSIQKSLYTLYAYGFNNITSQAFQDVYKANSNKFQCRDYFNKFENNLADLICNSNSLTLDNYQGIVTWTIAIYLYFDPEYLQSDDVSKYDWNKFTEWDAIGFILSETGIKTKEDLMSQIDSSLIKTIMNQIQDQFKETFKCFAPPCNRKFLAEQQFYLGKVTYCGKEKCPMYPSLNKRSVCGFKENFPLLKNKIPEMYGFYNIHYDFNGVIFGGEPDVIFSNNAGSIVNYYQMMVMYEFSRSGRTSDQAHLFNIWSNPRYLVHYVDHLFFEWFMEGLITEQKVSEMVKGYDDQTIDRIKVSFPLNSSNFLE